MTIENLVELHNLLCIKAAELMLAKNHDYTSGSGDPFANFRASAAIGVKPELALLVRMLDKIKRMQTFAEQGQLKVKDESVQDAVIDIINYAVLFYGLTKERPHDQDVLKLRDPEPIGC